MANSVDPDQTAPIGAVFSGSTLFASISSVLLGNYVQQTTSAARRHFQMHFNFGALNMLKVKHIYHAVRYLGLSIITL